MAKTTQHVVPNPDGGWSVKKSGSSRATKTFKSQSDATRYGSQIARNQKTELVTHSRDGRIESVSSYSKGNKK